MHRVVACCGSSKLTSHEPTWQTDQTDQTDQTGSIVLIPLRFFHQPKQPELTSVPICFKFSLQKFCWIWDLRYSEVLYQRHCFRQVNSSSDPSMDNEDRCNGVFLRVTFMIYVHIAIHTSFVFRCLQVICVCLDLSRNIRKAAVLFTANREL